MLGTSLLVRKVAQPANYRILVNRVQAYHYIGESGSRDWWKNMKIIIGLNGNSNSDMEELAKKTTDGDFAELANIINDIFLSVSDHLPRLDKDDNVFTVHEE